MKPCTITSLSARQFKLCYVASYLKTIMGLMILSGVALVLNSVVVVTTAAAAKFEAIEEWHLWKSEHGRQYSSINVSEVDENCCG